MGELDLTDPLEDDVVLADAVGYGTARLLVRSGRFPLGFVELAIEEPRIPLHRLQEAVAELGAPHVGSSPNAEPVSVVLCTRDRPEQLRMALASILQLDYPDVDVVIVDNASATDATQRVVAEFPADRVRLVSEPRPGLARARNRGVLTARNEVVAFTDDDVLVTPNWLTGLMDGFAAGADVACVCGMVPSGELRSYAQAYFDKRVTWARSCVPAVYRLSEPPAGNVLFPFQVGQYGTGANFAMRRSTVLELGGFDEALGVGSPTRGGEDIDMFVRVLLAGDALAYAPSAVIWHRNRADLSALSEQIAGYGLGLGAWVAKLLTNRRTAPMVARRAVRGAVHAVRMTKVAVRGSDEGVREQTGKLAATELVAALRGPLAYARARRAGASSTPLQGSRVQGPGGR